MTIVLEDHKSYSVSKEELGLLLAYVEQDVCDYTRQSTAFPLLKVRREEEIFLNNNSLPFCNLPFFVPLLEV